MAKLLSLCATRSPCPNSKIVKNLCSFVCSDQSKTPKVDISNSAEIDRQRANEVECCDELPLCTKMLGILTLRQMQKVCWNNFCILIFSILMHLIAPKNVPMEESIQVTRKSLNNFMLHGCHQIREIRECIQLSVIVPNFYPFEYQSVLCSHFEAQSHFVMRPKI